MRTAVSRRKFIKLASIVSGAAIVGFDVRTRSWVTNALAQSPFEKLPKLNGILLSDDTSREMFAVDVGNVLRLKPLAVLKPASVQDVVQMVKYANQHQLKIGMRGQGHSQWGQTLVDSGIVIDSSPLNAIKFADADSVDAQPGANWGEVNRLTLAKGLTPPVMGDTMTLSVGGIISAGGWGQRSHHFGAIVDNVRELDVVTGDGRLITCSETQNSELFDMVLAGMGQCALIVRARLRLVSSTSHLMRQELIYDDLGSYLADALQLVVDHRFDDFFGVAVREPNGPWRFAITGGMYYTSPQKPDLAPLVKSLRFRSAKEPTRVSYWEHLQRNAANLAAAKARKPLRSAAIALFVPASAAEDFLGRMLSTPSESDGLTRFAIPPLNTARFRRPLFKLPAEELAVSLWPRRYAELEDKAGHAALVDSNRAVFERMVSVGGKRYPPYSGFMSNADWQEHFGPAMWQRLSAAKKKFDPNNVLTPGPSMFA